MKGIGIICVILGGDNNKIVKVATKVTDVMTTDRIGIFMIITKEEEGEEVETREEIEVAIEIEAVKSSSRNRFILRNNIRNKNPLLLPLKKKKINRKR